MKTCESIIEVKPTFGQRQEIARYPAMIYRSGAARARRTYKKCTSRYETHLSLLTWRSFVFGAKLLIFWNKHFDIFAHRTIYVYYDIFKESNFQNKFIYKVLRKENVNVFHARPAAAKWRTRITMQSNPAGVDNIEPHIDTATHIFNFTSTRIRIYEYTKIFLYEYTRTKIY